MALRAVPNLTKLAAMVLLSAVAYSEFYAYYASSALWPSPSELFPDEPDSSEAQSSRLYFLLVADPQLQGDTGEPPFPLGPVYRWDSDRYLAKTFSWANYVYAGKIDAVVFLGDLLDEGSISDNASHARYVSRFRSIYPASAAKSMIFLSGDNDIGGEGTDPFTEEKRVRFESAFGPSDVVRLTADKIHVDVVPVNVIDKSMARTEAGKEVKEEAAFKVVVSHVPLSPPASSKFSREVFDTLKPDVIFSSHYHMGMDLVSDLTKGRPLAAANGSVSTNYYFSRRTDAAINTNLIKDRSNGVIHEIVVPTCSYRMGVREMAFGLAVLDAASGDLVYRNLWLPNRFSLLLLYAAAVAVVLVLVTVDRKCIRRRRRSSLAGRRSRRSSANIDYAKII